MLRRKDGFPLNVSYTKEGLEWTTNKFGRAVFFRKAIIRNGRVEGDLEPDSTLIVEKFDPIDWDNEIFRRAELRNLDKALRMCY